MRAALPFVLLGAALGVGAASAAGDMDMPAFKAERWVNSAPLDRRGAARQGRPGRLLGVHLHQLDPHRALRQGVAPRLRRRSAWSWSACTRPSSSSASAPRTSTVGSVTTGSTYPIALDNEFATWRALGNDAWPAKYLFDAQGKLVKRWVGEGGYDEIEAEIRRLLVAANPGITAAAGQPRGDRVREGPASPRTPASRARPTSAPSGGEPGAITLEGDWRSARQYVELQKRHRQDRAAVHGR